MRFLHGIVSKHGEEGSSVPGVLKTCFSLARDCVLFTSSIHGSVAAMSNDEDHAVFKDTTNEDVRLENLGYEQGEFLTKMAGSTLILRVLMMPSRTQAIVRLAGYDRVQL